MKGCLLLRWLMLLLSFLSFLSFSQKIDTNSSVRSLPSDRYYRCGFDNDYFTSSDENYTGGDYFEFVSPVLKENPVNQLFYRPADFSFKYGVAFEQLFFTPGCIKCEEIQYDDRPFASVFALKSFLIGTDTSRRYRIISSFQLGCIGPGAGGEAIQTSLHKLTNNTIPNGWHNQIRNDIVVNYTLSYEKLLLAHQNLFYLNSVSTVHLGTLFTNVTCGLTAAIGVVNSPFSSGKDRTKFRLYFYAQPLFTLVGRDGTLQGGVFERSSPHRISDSQIERLTAQQNYGIMFQVRRFYFEYSVTKISKEIGTGSAAKWGGVKFAFIF